MKCFLRIFASLLLLGIGLLPFSLVFAEGCMPTATTDCYTVLAGDNLTKIAQKFNTSASELKELNHLTSDIIRIGQVLVVPSDNASTPASATPVLATTVPATQATPTPAPVETVEPEIIFYGNCSGWCIYPLFKNCRSKRRPR